MGERFYADVSAGLSRIGRAAEEIRSKGREVNVTLAASTSFASMWMLPRLSALREDLPDIDLRIQTSVRDLDLDEENIPLGVRGGDPKDWPHYHTAELAAEIVSAVASPAFVEANGLPDSPAALARYRLIWLEEPVRQACSWPEWFASAGTDYRPTGRRLAINDYVLVIQAVLAGQGISLGWRHLVERLVDQGQLVEVGGHALRTGQAFHVVWPRSRELSAAATRVRDWLLSQT